MPKFNILIIGGGLGGLATTVALAQQGHKVTVLESTAKLQTIGGSITIPPNSMRVWDYLGLLPRLHAAAETSMPSPRVFRSYKGEEISEGGITKSVYKYDLTSLHRAPLQKLLLDAATEAGADIQINTRIIEIDESGLSPVAVTKDGRRIEADLIISADGAKSMLRSLLHPKTQLSTCINCYRAVIPGSMLRADPELSQLLETATIWWGPHRNIVGVPIQNGQLFSLECTHPGDTGTAGDWNKKGDVELMKATYSDFEPLVLKLLGMVKAEDLLVWKLNQLPELDSWVFGGGRVCLIGDAAHAMMPFSGQGHAMAIEDSAALSLCLARCTSTSSIPRALHAFEAIRKPRTTVLGKYSEHNARIWQLPDGPEQRERDERSRKSPFFIAPDWDGRHVDEVPGIPPDPLFFPYMLAHDVVAFVSFPR
ncbi:FAD/NAD(P)-binding domain-containing protein [Hyaloscypha bicolor E]|uniref:FAD/NAD(P)-binding domain-containing protein n=1 Tax=Hyaloscypha bicolor E TaxID=1095630 RepID=A0A2J6T9A8_9HELO|nr:FAD/NAD(P)-binding domain-containing protein [Hyaloscypha bicolor E]PMD59614.1 FAD/NAD(P)-binding domain-containing protein [Hyaloscypha bicolor E]